MGVMVIGTVLAEKPGEPGVYKLRGSLGLLARVPVVGEALLIFGCPQSFRVTNVEHFVRLTGARSEKFTPVIYLVPCANSEASPRLDDFDRLDFDGRVNARTRDFLLGAEWRWDFPHGLKES